MERFAEWSCAIENGEESRFELYRSQLITWGNFIENKGRMTCDSNEKKSLNEDARSDDFFLQC